jgi:hypothetical protein
MYVRIARFEGADLAKLDEATDEMRSQMAAMRSGELPADAPPEARTLLETVSRFMQLIDRKTGATVGIVFTETEDKMRRADEALNAMSPPDDSGMRRTGVEIYEVALDESLA